MAKKFTGSHSDGLVKQSNAYIKGAYWANVHRAHSGRRGIVNSFETYENVRRFLFGDTRVRIWLDNIALHLAPPEKKMTELYDFEFSLSVRGTGVFLHQRRQDPCENALRLKREDLENTRRCTSTPGSSTRACARRASRALALPARVPSLAAPLKDGFSSTRSTPCARSTAKASRCA